MKKFLALVLTMMMLVSMASITTYADAQSTAKIVIANDTASTGIDLTGKSFAVYRIFDATVADDQISYTWTTEFESYFTSLDGVVTDADAEAFIHATHDNEKMQELVADLAKHIDTNSIASVTTIAGDVFVSGSKQSLSSGDLEAGYYLVLDRSTNGSTMTAGMLTSLPSKDTEGHFTQNSTINLKGSQPKVDKDIWHNDLNSKGDWDTVGDYQIGDTVNFQITAGMPADLTGYTSYTYTITDTMTKGITFDPKSLKIYADPACEQEVVGDHHTETIFNNDPDNRIFQLDFDMIAIKAKFPVLKEFYIRYSGTVNTDAKLELNPETNKVDLDFSNNPYDNESFGHDEDTVYSYTFELDVLKTDATGKNPLANAVFALWTSPKDETLAPHQIYLLQDAKDPTVYYVQKSGTPDLDLTQDPIVAAGYIVTGTTGEFTIKGLDDATTYILKEIQAPAGYTKADDITFEITADYNGTTTPSLSTTAGETIKIENNGALSTTVLNTSSELFPGTGGMGTTYFLLGGLCLMLLATTILLVNRKKNMQ